MAVLYLLGAIFNLDNETEIDAVAGLDADLARIVLVGGTRQVVVEMTIKAPMRIESELDRRR